MVTPATGVLHRALAAALPHRAARPRPRLVHPAGGPRRGRRPRRPSRDGGPPPSEQPRPAPRAGRRHGAGQQRGLHLQRERPADARPDLPASRRPSSGRTAEDGEPRQHHRRVPAGLRLHASRHGGHHGLPHLGRQRDGQPARGPDRDRHGPSGCWSSRPAALSLVRRSLAPLDRVAATATRVSRLKLDSGDVALAERVARRRHRPAHRGGPGRAGPQQHARQRRGGPAGPPGEREAGAPVRRRRLPRAADAAGLHPRVCRAVPSRARAGARRRSPTPSVGSSPRRCGCRRWSRTCCCSPGSTPGGPLDREPVDLSLLAVDAVSDAHAAAPDHLWRLDLPDEPVEVTGDQRPAAPGRRQPARQRPHPHPGRHDRDHLGQAGRGLGAHRVSTTTARASRRLCSRTSSSGSPAATTPAAGRPAAPVSG